MRTSITLALVTLALTTTPAARSQAPPGTKQRTHQESDYILLAKGASFAAQNSQTGKLEFFGADAGAVLNGALGALPPEGGRIFVRAGTFVFSTTVDLRDRVQLDGAPGAVLSGPSLTSPLLRATGLEDVTVARLTLRDCGNTAIRLQGGARIRIEDCRFEDVQRQAIVNFTEELVDLWIEGCVVEGAGLSSDDQNFYSGINLYRVTNATVVDNRVRACGCTGIGVWSASGRVVLRNNDSSGNDVNAVYGQGHGIIVGGATSTVWIGGNVTNDNGANGIEANSGDPGARYVITGNTAKGNGLTQEAVNKGAGIYITHHDAIVANNICVEGQGAGIKVGYSDKSSRILVRGNIVGDNGRGAEQNPLHASGIALTGLSSAADPTVDYLVNVRVFDNLVYDSEGGTQYHAIYSHGDVEGVRIERNRVFGHANAEIAYTPSPHNRVARNEGFSTESAGTTTVPAGSTTWTVPHGLDDPPDLSWIGVTPQADLMSDGQARGWWLEGVTASDFTLRFSSALPGDVSFGWRCAAP